MDGIIETGSQSKKHSHKRFSEYIYTPDSQSVPKAVVVIGYILRAAVACLAVAGLTIFFTDAFYPELIDRKMILLAAAAWTAAFSVMRLSKKCFFIGLGVTCVTFAGLLLTLSDPIGFLPDSVFCAWDSICNRLGAMGFQSPGYIGSGYYGTVFQSSHLLGFAVFILIPVLSLIFTLSIMKRVRLLPMLAAGTLLCVPVFTYNFCDSNWGFALIITALCSILVLRHYDTCFRSKKITVRTSALGGYSGFTALLLSLLLVALPAANVTESWPVIKSISDKMSIARSIVASVIIGEKPNWSSVSAGGSVDSLGNRTTQASDRNYTGAGMVEVQANFDTPVYLRTWVAQHYYDDLWTTADSAEIESYIARFGEDFAPESITSLFYRDTGLNAERFSALGAYSNQAKYGFIASPVTINVLASGGNSLPVPSRFSTATGFLAYEAEDLSDLYGENVTSYHEGMYTTGWLNLNKKYTALAYLPLYRDPAFTENMDRLLAEVTFGRSDIMNYEAALSVISDYTFDQYLTDNSIQPSSNPVLLMFSEMTETQQRQYAEQLALYDEYSEYVFNLYGLTANSEIISGIAAEILQTYEAEHLGNLLSSTFYNFSWQHELVLSVVNYLRNNYTYTLHPKEGKDPELTAIESFLDETKEGYCVQYATAACLILRELGIPARYVEGYLADDLSYNKEHDTYGKYTQTLRDYNQHAWIEVYYDGIGWMTYEATSVFCDDLYKLYNSGEIGLPLQPETTEPVETLPSPVTNEADTTPETDGSSESIPFSDMPTAEDSRGIWLLLGILAGGGGLGAGFFFLFRGLSERKEKIIYERNSMLHAAMSKKVTSEESRLIARKLHSMIADTAKVGGLEPEKGELPVQYAYRIDSALAETPGAPSLLHPFSKIVPIIERGEFRGAVSREELRTLAEFFLNLTDETKKRLNPLEKLWYEKIRCVL